MPLDQISNTPFGNVQSTSLQEAINELDTETAKLAVEQTWAAQKVPFSGTLTDAISISWDCSVHGQSVKVTLSGNRTIAAPSNVREHVPYVIKVIQDATGGRTLTWDPAFKFPGDTAPTLVSTPGGITVITLVGGSTGIMHATTTGSSGGSGSPAATSTTLGTVRGNTEVFNSTSLGAYSLFNNSAGYYNIAIGESSLTSNIDGSTNIAVGDSALYSNTSGYAHTAVGHNALRSTTTSNGNTGVGYSAGYSITTGYNNTALGTSSMQWTTTGIQNTCVGASAGENIVSSNNTLIGYAAGVNVSTGSGNTIIGANATGSTSGLTNNIILANGTGAVKAQHDGKDWAFTGEKTIIRAGSFAVAGDSQVSTYHLRRLTTDTTSTYLTGDGTAQSSTNIPVLTDNSIWAINALITARDTTTNDGACWTITGSAKRGSGAATVTVSSFPTTTIYADAGASGWGVNLVANTTLGGFSIVAVGEAATTIRWTCRIDTTEVA